MIWIFFRELLSYLFKRKGGKRLQMEVGFFLWMFLNVEFEIFCYDVQYSNNNLCSISEKGKGGRKGQKFYVDIGMIKFE